MQRRDLQVPLGGHSGLYAAMQHLEQSIESFVLSSCLYAAMQPPSLHARITKP